MVCARELLTTVLKHLNKGDVLSELRNWAKVLLSSDSTSPPLATLHSSHPHHPILNSLISSPMIAKPTRSADVAILATLGSSATSSGIRNLGLRICPGPLTAFPQSYVLSAGVRCAKRVPNVRACEPLDE